MDKNLPWVTKVSYGVGHVFNDLCASMWFTYLLLFYQNVLQFDNTLAGLILLVGQIADGISTPIVGIFSDKENKIPICARYGRRKTWHLMGTVLCFIAFPFIFNVCLGCEDLDDWAKFGYYFIFVVIFQFGWACVQISHLALIPDLTTRKCQRTELNSIRYAFTVLANLSVFTITFFSLNTGQPGPEHITGGDSYGNDTYNDTSTPFTTDPYYASTSSGGTAEPTSANHIGPEDAASFRNIALICCGIGVVFSLIFHIGVKEPPFIPHKKRCELPPSSDGEKRDPSPAKMRKIDWFKELPFYQIAVLYMATRLYVNLYQAYIPLYVQDTLRLDQTFLALVPFAMYLAGFTGSLLMKEINKKIGRKRTFALGCCVGIAGCVWLWFGEGSYYEEWGIFLVGALLGIGGSTLLITSLSITADLIGENVEGGAFVYGFMSLVDKFSNGIIIMIIQESNPEEPWYYRSVITFACGSACALGIAVVISLMNVRIGQSRSRDVALSIFEDSDTSTTTTAEGGGSSPAKCGLDNPALNIISEVSIQSIPPPTVNGTCCKDKLPQNSSQTQENTKY
ncbi:major facilitator superfamily domain-containing protein 12-like [Portunus trituberculatus]|uniref:major facilitator superfamily domain-containing protein 12-like n=1 Tax=Portunus trituberculatus TaxID=210409 RepID=UPI001E1D21B2|nr:major facilitator superfamily domain-containing protein 12-like [Portunus trituberculatus]XP_045121607.1 major facilitator superfamily domain-containing protein 12-like [Portunus trituberculatus]XP_045121608.1 major facilitator superfamily domain-containing protein 12-like [Portunus trituberculatus]XP_045121609.1 major facilitator superfamily domain-containing protein 12-like [Portunus trituberculatus]XP_045121611.1 major facilitator superfamily domain-containing protein 12-like [Portunus tr